MTEKIVVFSKKTLIILGKRLKIADIRYKIFR